MHRARQALVLAELEDTLIVSMLFNFSNNMRGRLEQEVLDACSWQVKRVEEYIPRLQRRRPLQPGVLKGIRRGASGGAGKKTALKKVVERKGIEPSTYALRTHRSPN